jgi:hypothetical protein
MKTETKTENELIAEFMGFEKTSTFYDTADDRHYKYKSELFGYTYPSEWAFHIKWDWLMPVVEKIETLKFSVMVIGKYTRIQCPHPYKEFATDICETKIQSVYKAVVEFIKWYNQQKP